MFICDISVFNKYGKQTLDAVLRPLDADWRELVVMLVVAQVPGISQSRLVPVLQTDKANVTKLLQAMERKGLIRRETPDDDQRNRVAHLTERGKQLVPQLQEALARWEAACFAGISKRERAEFERISETITRNLIKDQNSSI